MFYFIPVTVGTLLVLTSGAQLFRPRATI